MDGPLGGNYRGHVSLTFFPNRLWDDGEGKKSKLTKAITEPITSAS